MQTPARAATLAAIIVTALTGCHPAAPRAIATPVAPQPLAAPSRSLVELDAIGSTRLVAIEGAADWAVRIRVTAPPMLAEQRAPLSLAMVLDTSGSMDGAPMVAAREAARTLITKMGPRDRVAIVAFHSRSELVVPMTALDDAGRRRTLAAIDELEATGTTDLAGGLAVGLDELLRNRLGGIDRMVLLSDGVPNDGVALASLVARAAQAQIAISTLGIGLEFDESLLGRIAQDTGGEYRYAPDAEAVARIFDDELIRMQTLVASNLTLTLRPGPGVTLGDAPWLTAAGTARQAFLGDLAAGETRDVFVPVRLGAHPAGATIEVLDAELALVDATTGQPAARHAFVGVKASDDHDAVARAVVIDLVAGRARADAAGVILQAIGLARQGLIDRAEQMLVDGERTARAAAADGDDELELMARRMVDIRKALVLLRAAQAAAVQPDELLLRSPPPGPDRMAPSAEATAGAYPLDRRPTTAGPAPAEAVLKDAYRASRKTLRSP